MPQPPTNIRHAAQTDTTNQIAASIALATVTAVNGKLVQVTRAGQTVPDSTFYPTTTSAGLSVGDTVVISKVGASYVVSGRVGGSISPIGGIATVTGNLTVATGLRSVTAAFACFYTTTPPSAAANYVTVGIGGTPGTIVLTVLTSAFAGSGTPVSIMWTAIGA